MIPGAFPSSTWQDVAICIECETTSEEESRREASVLNTVQETSVQKLKKAWLAKLNRWLQ